MPPANASYIPLVASSVVSQGNKIRSKITIKQKPLKCKKEVKFIFIINNKVSHFH